MDEQARGWGTVTPHRCRRHEWYFYGLNGEPITGICMRCGKPKDDVASRRGRTNQQRGNAIERDVAKQLGLRRVGQYGGPEDVSGDAFVVQVKSTSPNKVTGRYAGWFSDRVWNELKRLPANAGQTPLLVVTDAPGPGHKRRAVVMLTLEDWIALHGNLTPDV